MFRFLIKLRNKSDKEKITILIISTIVVMIFVVVIWLFSYNVISKKNQNIEDSNNSIVVFKSIGDQMVYSFENIQKVFKEARKNLGF